MNDNPRLERAYRWLLLAYPRRFRRDKGTEILTTLLDAAPPDRRRPTAWDAVDLLAGGARARFLPPPGAAAAVLATVVALLMGIGAAAAAGWLGWQASSTMPSAAASAATAQVVFGQPAQAPVVDPGDPLDLDWLGVRTAPGDEGSTGPPPAPGAVHLRLRTGTQDVAAVLAGARERLAAAGWRTDQPTADGVFWASKGDQIVRVTALLGDRDPNGGGSWSVDDPVYLIVSVHRPAPTAVTTLALAGLLAGAVAGWLLAAWALHARARHRSRLRTATMILGLSSVTLGVVTVLLPTVAGVLGLAAIDGWSPHDSLIAAAVLRGASIMASAAGLGLAGTAVLAAFAPAVAVPAGPLPRAKHPVVWLVALSLVVALLGLSGQIVIT
ncbi:hypothetical protein OHA72_39865 [Dactylosporangium sp. NBC_01737]|uniref:hypothetical protein n=1 Tax=Dactylosporangium sp. NBC_01737 TaxID=2975959 RepID=UPI002E0E47D7|nr:hypothetical protein OHA72_39865 [Dactylosporangium sp. NBC_01737]